MAKRLPRNEVVAKLENAFKMDMNIAEACAVAGIGVRTYYDWINASPELAERFNEAREHLFAVAKAVVAKAIQAGDHETALKLLERRQPGVYSLKHLIETKEVDEFANYNEEQLDKFLKDNDDRTRAKAKGKASPCKNSSR